jgi:hypothetical protein
VFRRTTRIALAASLALLALGVATAASATARPVPVARFGARRVKDTAISSNWAGYVATGPATTGSSFTDVAGSWRQPRLRCSAGGTGSAAFWVGLGGAQDSSAALEQTGTEGDCSRSGKATYSAWYEFVPAGPVTVRLAVRPGDRMTGAVLVSGTKVTVTLKNLTTHKAFSKTFASVSPLDTSSAEWVAEAPSDCSSSGTCTVVPLANFGAATFTDATAIADGHAGPLADPAWSATSTVLEPDPAARSRFTLTANEHGALPGPISPDGRSFSVSWLDTPAVGR